MQRFIYTSRILSTPGRIRPPRFSRPNTKIHEMEKIMQSQADLLKDQDNTVMMENVLKVHASNSSHDVSRESLKEDADWYLDTASNIPSKWDSFIPKWKRFVKKIPSPAVIEDHPTLDIAAIIDVIKRENGLNSVVVNMTEKCDYTDAFIFTQGNNTRHVVAIAEAVKKLVIY